MSGTISEIDGLQLDFETHRILSSANLKTFNAALGKSDLELYRLLHNDISRVKEVRDVVANEMKRLGHWKPRPGEIREWLPDQLLMAIEAESLAEQHARATAENARIEKQQADERRARDAAVHAEYQNLTELNRLGFSVRIRTCLYNEGLLTIKDIARVSDFQLLAIPNFGKRSLREVREIVPAKPRVRIRAWTAPYQSPISDERHAF